MKYLYCLTKITQKVNIMQPGIGGKKVHQIFGNAIAALASDCNSAGVEGKTPDVITHQKVVQEAFRLCSAIIPCRFGTLYETEEEVRNNLNKHETVLFAHLSKLENKIEVSARMILSATEESKGPAATDGVVSAFCHDGKLLADPFPTDGEVGGPEGTSYLLSKKQARDGMRELQEKAKGYCSAMKEATAPFWEEVIEQEQPVGNSIMCSLHYLLFRENLHQFKIAYQNYVRTIPDLKPQYTGPWPPYNFSSIELHT